MASLFISLRVTSDGKTIGDGDWVAVSWWSCCVWLSCSGALSSRRHFLWHRSARVVCCNAQCLCGSTLKAPCAMLRFVSVFLMLEIKSTRTCCVLGSCSIDFIFCVWMQGTFGQVGKWSWLISRRSFRLATLSSTTRAACAFPRSGA